MKKIIAIALIMCATTVSAQLTTSTYKSDHVLISEVNNPEQAEWIIYDNNTPEDSTDDVIKQFIYNTDGDLIKYKVAKIESVFVNSNRTFTFKVRDEKNHWYNIVFWESYEGGPEPLVAYDYSDGYILYSGDVKY